MGSLNDYRMANYTQEEEGGSIGLWIPDPDNPGEKKKVWWDEDKFVEMFTEGDKKTKEIMRDAMTSGKDIPSADAHKRDMWAWEDKGKKGAKPVRSDIPSKPEKIPPMPPKEMSPLTRAEDFQADDTTRTVDAPRSKEITMTPEMRRHQTPNPYTREGRRRPQQEPITIENMSRFAGEQTRGFTNYIDKKYKSLNIPLKQEFEGNLAKGLPSAFESFAASRGFPNARHMFIDDYKKSKEPEYKELMDAWREVERGIKEKSYQETVGRRQKLEADRGLEYHNFNNSLKELERDLSEADKRRRAAESPENRMKLQDSLVKAEKALLKAREEGGSENEEAFLGEKIQYLKAQLGMKDEPQISKSEDKKRAYLESTGMSDENIERYLKKHGERK